MRPVSVGGRSRAAADGHLDGLTLEGRDGPEHRLVPPLVGGLGGRQLARRVLRGGGRPGEVGLDDRHRQERTLTSHGRPLGSGGRAAHVGHHTRKGGGDHVRVGRDGRQHGRGGPGPPDDQPETDDPQPEEGEDDHRQEGADQPLPPRGGRGRGRRGGGRCGAGAGAGAGQEPDRRQGSGPGGRERERPRTAEDRHRGRGDWAGGRRGRPRHGQVHHLPGQHGGRPRRHTVALDLRRDVRGGRGREGHDLAGRRGGGERGEVSEEYEGDLLLTRVHGFSFAPFQGAKSNQRLVSSLFTYLLLFLLRVWRIGDFYLAGFMLPLCIWSLKSSQKAT